jgi:hypothetical protein
VIRELNLGGVNHDRMRNEHERKHMSQGDLSTKEEDST